MSTYDERAIAENRACPYSPRTGRHVIASVTRPADGLKEDHCRHCGTTTATIIREQPALGDKQPRVAT